MFVHSSSSRPAAPAAPTPKPYTLPSAHLGMPNEDSSQLLHTQLHTRVTKPGSLDAPEKGRAAANLSHACVSDSARFPGLVRGDRCCWMRSPAAGRPGLSGQPPGSGPSSAGCRLPPASRPPGPSGGCGLSGPPCPFPAATGLHDKAWGLGFGPFLKRVQPWMEAQASVLWLLLPDDGAARGPGLQ